MTGPVVGDDGLPRCPWGDSPADYRAYHDDEWGRPIYGDSPIFERLSLEAYQAGLSWLTILRRRDAFREAYAGFDIAAVAAFEANDIDRLAADARLIRHRGKAAAVVSNARVLRDWQRESGEGVLEALVWGYASDAPAPRAMVDVPAESAASRDLVQRLKSRGWRFIGATSAYAALQAMGVVNDHLEGCHARASADPVVGGSSA